MERKVPQDARTAYKNEWDRKNTKQYKLKLMLRTDADIIEKLESVENRQAYLKDLIRKDIGSPLTVTVKTDEPLDMEEPE